MMFSTLLNGKTPDITPAQVLSVLATLVGLLVSNTVIDSKTAKLITDLAAIIVPAAWMLADAHIRNGRAKALLAPSVVWGDVAAKGAPTPVAPTVKQP
jgi:hypothetical protein